MKILTDRGRTLAFWIIMVLAGICVATIIF